MYFGSLGIIQIGNCPSDTKHSVQSSRGQSGAPHRNAQHRPYRSVQRDVRSSHRLVHPTIERNAWNSRETEGLTGSSRMHPPSHLNGALGISVRTPHLEIRGQAQFADIDRSYFDSEIHPIQQWSRHLPAISRDRSLVTKTCFRTVPEATTRARIHGGEEKHLGRERDGSVRPSQRYRTLLKRLPQDFEGISTVLGHFIEKKNPAVRETEFTWTQRRASSDEPRIADGVVRSSKRGCAVCWVIHDKPSHRTYARHFQRFIEVERRKKPRQTASEHGLARPRWTDQKEVVPSGGRDLERAFRRVLPSHIRQVQAAGRPTLPSDPHTPTPRPNLTQPCHPCQVFDDLGERSRSKDGLPLHHGCVFRIAEWKNDSTHPLTKGAHHDRQDAANGMEAPVESQLSHKKQIVEFSLGDDASGSQDPHSDGKIKTCSLLADPGRSKVDRDPAKRQSIPRTPQRGRDSFPTLANSTLWQAYDRERR